MHAPTLLAYRPYDAIPSLYTKEPHGLALSGKIPWNTIVELFRLTFRFLARLKIVLATNTLAYFVGSFIIKD